MQRTPSVSKASAPSLIRVTAMPSSPALAAKCRGVSPSTSEEFTLAPAAHRSVTMGTLPHAAASWIGVHRVTSCKRDSGKGTAM